jgi:hypothetical protein
MSRGMRLSEVDRRAAVEIVKDTKPGLPAYFGEARPGSSG